MDIVQIRRAKLDKDKLATTRLWSCFGLTRAQSWRTFWEVCYE